MSIYKDHIDKQRAEKLVAEQSAKEQQEAKEYRALAVVAAGKKWLEDFFIPQIREAKKAVEEDVRVVHAEHVSQRQTRTGIVNEVTFTMNPTAHSLRRSYVFALMIDNQGAIASESRTPGGDWDLVHEVVRRDELGSDFNKFGLEGIQEYLKLRLQAALNMAG